MKGKKWKAILAAVIILGMLPANVAAVWGENVNVPEKGAALNDFEEKYSYMDVLPLTEAQLSAAEKTEIRDSLGLLDHKPQKAAEIINTFENDVFEVAVQDAFDYYFADAENVDRDALDLFVSRVDERADAVLAGYEDALKERQNAQNLDFETEHVIVMFDEGMRYEDVRDIAGRIGEADIIDGTARTLEQCIEDGIYQEGQKITIRLDIGISGTVQDAVEMLQSVEGIAAVEPNGFYTIDSVGDTDDPDKGSQNYLNQIDTFGAWEAMLASNDKCSYRQVKVAVIDSGVDFNHEDLKDIVSEDSVNIKEKNENGYYRSLFHSEQPFIGGHGTHVAGIIAAKSNNGVGTASITSVYDPSGRSNEQVCRILAINAAHINADNEVRFTIQSLIDAINYAVNRGVDVINMSLGGYSYYTAYQEAIDKAYEKGIVVVASAGNDNTSKAHYPSDYEHVFSVASLDVNATERRSSSNFGKGIDLAAPGSDIVSTKAGTKDEVVSMSGTSMASPVVAATAAFMRAVNPDLSVDDIEYYLEKTADDLYTEGWDEYTGFGRVNVNHAVQTARLERFRKLEGKNSVTYKFHGSAIDLLIDRIPLAEYYRVEKAENANGPYQLVADHVDFDELENGKVFYREHIYLTDTNIRTYYYKVTAVMKSYDYMTDKERLFTRDFSPSPLQVNCTLPSVSIRVSSEINNSIELDTSFYSSFYIFRADTPEGPFTQIGRTNSFDKTFTVSGEKGKTYYFQALGWRDKFGSVVFADKPSNTIAITIK